jgi:phosphoribosylformylglycinamidine cyclo-ligase
VKSRDKGDYALAGVDITTADTTKELIKQHVRSTFGPEVLNDIGLFGGMYEFKGYSNPVLVSSADGVGTKIKIATLLNKYDTVGIDLVNHCVNDILCCGASPLFFLDYIGMGKLVPEKAEQLAGGLAQACREVGCALIGGETAEMPGVYRGDDYDLVGFIVGVVEKDRIINGSTITPGDVLLALSSNGLHTNGFSLVRKVFKIENEPYLLKVFYPELGRNLSEELLEPHKCYYSQLKPVLPLVKGLAHITGGGLIGNLPRIFPEGIGALIEKNSWSIPPIFDLIKRRGDIEEAEMFRVFNMGIGMVIVCDSASVDRLIKTLPDALIIGKVIEASDGERLIIK